MRVLETKKTRKLSKYFLGILGLTSICIAAAGAILFNPFLLGAGVAGLFLSCGAAVSIKKPQTTTFV